MPDEPLLQLTRPEARIGLLRWFGIARDRYGTHPVRQVLDLLRLTRGETRLSVREYYLYHLFDDARYPPEAKASFVGEALHIQLNYELLDASWPHLAADKPTLLGLLGAHGLPTPTTQALYHPFRAMAGVPTLPDRAAVARFLRTEARYPLFLKRGGNHNSLGSASIERYEADRDALILHGGRAVPVEALVEALAGFVDHGVLFQERVGNHPALAAWCGEGALASCRVLVLVEPEGPRIARAALRIPTGAHHADTFWRPGNLLAALDPDTGEVRRVVQGERAAWEPIHQHPDTGAAFARARVPEWEAVRRLVLDAAAAFPRCWVQGWDVALTPEGPTLLELEGDGGHPMVYQLPFDTGLFDGPYRALVDRARERARRVAVRARAMQADRVREAWEARRSAGEPTGGDRG